MTVNSLPKHIRQKNHYQKQLKLLKKYNLNLNELQTRIKHDFEYLKDNNEKFNTKFALTCIERQEFKKIKNRYYRNKDYCRFLKRKIEKNSN